MIKDIAGYIRNHEDELIENWMNSMKQIGDDLPINAI